MHFLLRLYQEGFSNSSVNLGTHVRWHAADAEAYNATGSKAFTKA